MQIKTRAKVYVESVKITGKDDKGDHTHKEVQMRCVGGKKVQKGYPEDGSDEDNTFAKFSPSGDFRITIANPALFGEFKPEQKRYVDISEPVD